MSRYSVSRINTYLENPFKHWAKYIAKYKPKRDPEYTKYMDRGTVFHRCMELLAQGSNTSEAVALALTEAHEKQFVQEAKDSGIVAFERYLENYPEVNTPEYLKNIIHTEYELNYEIKEGSDFIGYIDAIISNDDGTVTLVDYKTYSNAPQQDKMAYSLQAHMYMYVATQLGMKVKNFVFDCVNPKLVLKGRAYKVKKIEFPYNPATAQQMYNEFCTVVDMIEVFPEYKLYKAGDYMPDMYDLLFKVWVGDINEDLDEFVAQNFEPFDEEEDDEKD